MDTLDLMDWGVRFTASGGDLSLGREGGQFSRGCFSGRSSRSRDRDHVCLFTASMRLSRRYHRSFETAALALATTADVLRAQEMVIPALLADAPAGAVSRGRARRRDCTARRVCGVLCVSEDRERPGESDLFIDIAFVVLEALEPDRRVDDAIIVLPGGPGQALVNTAIAQSRRLGDELRRRRDVVLVDVRGVGRSAGLSCTVPYPRGFASRFGTLFPLDHAIACRDELSRRARLEQYTTAATVDDLEELSVWLGFRAFNLLGSSYGTRVAQVYMSATVPPYGLWC